MESLSLPVLNPLLASRSNLYKNQSSRMTSPLNNFPRGCSTSLSTVRRLRVGVVRMQAVDEDIDLKQMRDMAAAKKRWDGLLREGKVKLLTPREAGYAISLSNKPLLDVRPSSERNKYLTLIRTIDNLAEMGLGRTFKSPDVEPVYEPPIEIF
ncbi:PREDICTED: rhodanese-like domain-containing protein 11, chloroplastic [Camelina sativa]|uniref:Rhodanese-like domain-containing protein 11, chloroplastic n=1 Tax=Camelina sativa TaxID=90675 RepID=A0ABM0URR8_CAMSA|nr:PREDICTED: rhodanese-like domain-containing protein 11, chloroplastic [Camelina sativa]